MSRRARAALGQADQNQAAILKDLRRLNLLNHTMYPANVISLQNCSALGENFPDLVIGHRGRNYLVEIKNLATGGTLSKGQEEFHDEWSGQCGVAHTTTELLAIIGYDGARFMFDGDPLE